MRDKLFAALAKAQQAARGVEKSKQVAFGNRYKYASGEDVVAEARRAMAAEGLAFTVVGYAVSHRDGMLWLTSRYLLTHSSGESLDISSETPIIPDKGRPEDKATATAKTYDLSYVLRGVLLLERVEEGAEVDARDDTNYEPKQRLTPQQIQKEATQPEPEKSSKRQIWDRIQAAISKLGDGDAARILGCAPAKVSEWAPANEGEAVAKLTSLETALIKRGAAA